MTDQRMEEAGYYHARAADMMSKAQVAPSKATRVAYLNLARAWARKAANLENEEAQPQAPDSGAGPGAARAAQK